MKLILKVLQGLVVVNKSVSVWGLFKIKASSIVVILLAPARVKAEHRTEGGRHDALKNVTRQEKKKPAELA